LRSIISIAALTLVSYNWQIMILRIGTRGSPLALAQARETSKRLANAHGLDPDQIEIVAIKTSGDMIRDRPLAEIGGKGLFTKEIEDALFAGTIDLAVHSMKDMPAQLPVGLDIAAILPREDARDAFISSHHASLDALPHGARLGSSSVRRTAQALRHRPDLVAIPFRGNVETRLHKIHERVADATFLACAGLIRLGLAEKITVAMPIEIMLPAVAQGAIGIEIASHNNKLRNLLSAINHPPSEFAVNCERAFLAALSGSCRTPLAGHATISNGTLSFACEALTPDGLHCFSTSRSGPAADSTALGHDAGEEIKSRGGDLIAFE
jgi:hydroxymethylbilane synthase